MRKHIREFRTKEAKNKTFYQIFCGHILKKGKRSVSQQLFHKGLADVFLKVRTPLSKVFYRYIRAHRTMIDVRERLIRGKKKKNKIQYFPKILKQHEQVRLLIRNFLNPIKKRKLGQFDRKLSYAIRWFILDRETKAQVQRMKMTQLAYQNRYNWKRRWKY